MSARGKSKSIRSADESSRKDSRSPAAKTCELYGPTNRKGERTFHPLNVARQVSASHTKQQAGLILSAEASPAKTSPSPESGGVLPENAADSSGKSSASARLCGRRGGSSRMFQGCFPPTTAETLASLFRDSANAFLLSDSECWTASISESPSAAVASSLSAVLQS